MSFRVRISIIMTVLVSLLFSVGSTIIIHRSYMTSLDREEREAVDSLQMVNSVFRLSYESSGKLGEDQLLRILRSLGTYKTSSDVFLLYKDDVLIYGNFQNIEMDIDLDNLINENDDEEGISVNYAFTDGTLRYIISSTSIYIGNEIYVICICRDISSVVEMRERLYSIFVKSFFIALFVTTIVSRLLSIFVVKPLKNLTKATREIADGNLSYRSDIHSNDEVGALSRDFDTMADKLQENMDLLKEAAEEKDRFMGAFTHELKTPMTSIIGYAELLRTQDLEEEDRQDALEYIYSESKRLESMSLKLLQLFVSDKDKPEFKEVSPKEMVEDIVVHLKPTLEEQNIDISCETQEGRTYLEPALVRTLIINLIDNSRKAMDKKGLINVIQKMVPEGVTFSITDNGKGMPKEAIEHVTEAFYRVDKSRSRAQGGAGLGLALVSKIVELHEGAIDIASEIGQGTSVTVTLKNMNHFQEIEDETLNEPADKENAEV